MTVATTIPLMTYEEFMDLPDDGLDRELIRGVVKVRGEATKMTRRSRKHCRVSSKVTAALEIWMATQPQPRGEVLVGEAAFRLSDESDSGVGIDVAYVDSDLIADTDEDAFEIVGPPTLAVEVLSASDQHRDIVEKIELYLEAGVPVVWVIDPDLKVVHVHRPNEEPISFNIRHELTAEPDLPGFRIAVADLFA
ncbi:MAG: Uma2 family endonuclease [Planctomycetaceae bacterium]